MGDAGWLLLCLLLPWLAGCQTAGYYTQAMRGHCQIMARQQPIADLLAQPQTPEPLKQQFRVVLALREFAEQELKLPVNGHYLRYADLGRRYVVWNVTAAPELSLKAETWWYPFVGRLAYRGYFDEAAARCHAAALALQGYDVNVGGVRAYSTLGWFRDPALNTFIHEPETELAELLFHELGHQRLFAGGDTDFSEAYAEAVAEEGTRRWLRAHRDASAQREYEARLRRKSEFTQLVTGARGKLEHLYRELAAGGGAHAPAVPPPGDARADARHAKEEIIAQLRRDYAALKTSWGSRTDYDKWFARPLNNSHLNDVDTYYRLVPAFHRLLRQQGGDLVAFHRAAHALTKLSKPERHRQLELLLAAP